MENTIYHIRIKKEYATELMADLLQVDAIEIVEENIPEWQKEETLNRLFNLNKNAEMAISEEQFFELLSKDVK